MSSTDFFHPGRFYYFLRRQAMLDSKSWLVELSSFAGLLLVVTILQWIQFSYNYATFEGFGLLIYVVGGLILTSRSFDEIRQPSKALLYMNYPASVFEKLATIWLTRGIVYSVVVYLLILLMSIVCGSLSASIVGAEWQVFNPFETDNLKTVGHFLVWQSIFLFGAVYFKNNNFLKTVLGIVGISLFLSLFTGLSFYALIYLQNPESQQFILSGGNVNTGIGGFMDNISLGLYVALGLFFLLVAYFHLKEREF